MNRAQSVEIESSRLGLNNEDFVINVNQDNNQDNNDSDSNEGTPVRTLVEQTKIEGLKRVASQTNV